MQKNFILEVYDLNGKKTYIVRQPNMETKGYDAVLITGDPVEVSNFISNK